jgi:hypothetical protein
MEIFTIIKGSTKGGGSTAIGGLLTGECSLGKQEHLTSGSFPLFLQYHRFRQSLASRQSGQYPLRFTPNSSLPYRRAFPKVVEQDAADEPGERPLASSRDWQLTGSGHPLRVTGGKTPNGYMFSELPQIADIVRSAFHHLANPPVLQITAFWVRVIPG